MKTLLRNIFIFTFSLYVLPQFAPGFSISGEFWTLVTAGVVLSMLFFFLKPVLKVISFPINAVTLGLFNIFINALLLYLLTVFVSEVTLTAFTLKKSTVFGFTTPEIFFNTFFAYVYAAFIVTLISSGLKWIMK